MTLLELLQLLKKKIALVIILPLICAIAAGVYSYGFLQDEYTAKVQLYVLTQSTASASASYATSSDTTASQQLANDIAVLAGSESVKSATASALNMKSLKGYDISISSSTANRVISLEVTSGNAEAVATVANALALKTAERSVQIMGFDSVNVINNATVPTAPSGPNRPLYVAVAFLAGLFIAIAIIVLADMLNTTVKTREEAEELFGLPVLGVMPELKGRR